ncbi:hypothetical protein D3C74_184770 [compost metagenome]
MNPTSLFAYPKLNARVIDMRPDPMHREGFAVIGCTVCLPSCLPFVGSNCIWEPLSVVPVL